VLAHIFVWLFVFTVPWQNMVVLPGLGTISALCGAAAIGATILQVALRGKVRGLVRFHWATFLFFMWVFLSAFWAIARPESVLKDLSTYIQIFVMVWVIWEASLTRARVLSLLQAYVLGAYVAAGSTIMNYVTGVGFREDAERFAASGFDPNDLGALLALALPMAWYLASTAPSALWRWLNRLYFVAGTVAILLTGSRGAMLTTMVALMVVPLTLTQIRRGLRIAAVIIMIGTGIAAVRFVPQEVFLRLSTTSSEISEGTLNNRLRVWKAAMAQFPERPVQGYGPAGWYPALGLRIGNVAPHNTWIAILLEEGIVGLLLYLSIFLVLWSRLLTLPTFERRAGLILLTTLAVAITPLGWQQNKASWLVLALLAGWAYMLTPSPQAETFDPAMWTPPRRPGRPAPPVSVT
jgi:O-antigen ligase